MIFKQIVFANVCTFISDAMKIKIVQCLTVHKLSIKAKLVVHTIDTINIALTLLIRTFCFIIWIM